MDNLVRVRKRECTDAALLDLRRTGRPSHPPPDRIAVGALSLDDPNEFAGDSRARLCSAWLGAPKAFVGLRPAQGLFLDIDENIQRQSRRDLSRVEAVGEGRPDPGSDPTGLRDAPPANISTDSERPFRTQEMDHPPDHPPGSTPGTAGSHAPLCLFRDSCWSCCRCRAIGIARSRSEGLRSSTSRRASRHRETLPASARLAFECGIRGNQSCWTGHGTPSQFTRRKKNKNYAERSPHPTVANRASALCQSRCGREPLRACCHPETSDSPRYARL